MQWPLSFLCNSYRTCTVGGLFVVARTCLAGLLGALEIVAQNMYVHTQRHDMCAPHGCGEPVADPLAKTNVEVSTRE